MKKREKRKIGGLHIGGESEGRDDANWRGEPGRQASEKRIKKKRFAIKARH